jgi:hypothetical protein
MRIVGRKAMPSPGGLQADRKGAFSETGAPCVLPCQLA